MKQTAVEWLYNNLKSHFEHDGDLLENVQFSFDQAKEMEEKNLLEMLHKFGFDYTYNYKGEKTIYEWIPEWFEEYKRVQQFKNK